MSTVLAGTVPVTVKVPLVVVIELTVRPEPVASAGGVVTVASSSTSARLSV